MTSTTETGAENPALETSFGERFVFRATAAETDGKLLRMDTFLDAGGGVRRPLHAHPKQEERFIVHDAVYEEFVDRFVAEIESFTVGNPMDHDTDVGPQARQDLMDGVHEQVTESVDAGATVLTGGEPLDRDGAYYPLTVLADVPPGCPVDAEEVFGPVAAVYRVPDEDTAIEKANDTEFGLGASVWTDDIERGERIAGRIDAGCTYINELV
jgi:succinate-semialdehyde dehydrogenase/glutarate-semialdehyde dehydrogenase